MEGNYSRTTSLERRIDAPAKKDLCLATPATERKPRVLIMMFFNGMLFISFTQ